MHVSDTPLVLVIDDDPEILHWLMVKLKEGRFRSKTALNVLEGVHLARQDRPTVILMDIQMPGIEGHLASSLLKETEELKDVPILLMSALSEEEARSKVAESEAVAFLQKPLEEKALVELLRRVIG